MKFILISMIRNESRIIERCLKALENVVDAYCVCDTGSTDNTIEIVNNFLKTHIGCLTHEPWKNFGYNRTISFLNAQKYLKEQNWDLHSTYGLLLDADMVFVPGKLKEQNLVKEGYSIQQINGNLEYYNCRLVRMDYAWKCNGVTHEYWDGPTSNLGRDICYIDDKNDGGCKHDKFERDQRLLEEGLMHEPKNGRYMFYLAQTYKCLGQFEKSISMYSRRIEAGGWDEELWYSHYMIADCYKNLNKIPEYECWMLKAYECRPSRAESLYSLCEFFRLHSQHYKAYHYALLGDKIPKTNDVLFVESYPYNGGFLYEKTILDYYIGNNNGLKNSIAYLLKYSKNSMGVISNLKFYVKAIDCKIEPITLDNPFSSEFTPSAISVYEYPIANVRFVNYKIQKDGSYWTPNGVVVTKNAFMNLKNGKEIFSMQEPEYIFDSHIQGLEDLRLYSFQNKLYFTATSYKQFIQDKISIVHGEYSKTCTGIESPLHSDCEKNWVNIPETNTFIYSWHPFRIGEIHNNMFQITKIIDTPMFFSHIRGSASPLKIQNKYVTLVHFVEYCVPRKYYHCFIETDLEWNISRISLPFFFRENAIEFCITTYLQNDNIVCIPSLNDCNPCKCIIPFTSISWINV